MLADLKNFLRTQKSANLLTLARHLKVDVALTRQMLGHFIRKGCVRPCAPSAACQTKCQGCNPLMVESYEWVA